MEKDSLLNTLISFIGMNSFLFCKFSFSLCLLQVSFQIQIYNDCETQRIIMIITYSFLKSENPWVEVAEGRLLIQLVWSILANYYPSSKCQYFLNLARTVIDQPHQIFACIFFFFNYTFYAVTVAPISPICPFHPATPSGNPPHHCAYPWVICTSASATPFPIL